jgi:lipoate-protein ligase A
MPLKSTNYIPQQWRLYITHASPGAWNMALDEALLEAVEKNHSPATLRLYAWEPACLSIGYAQPSSDIDFQRLVSAGWDWVRRPTGGRAILHTDELTYSVIAPQSDPRVAGGVLESYQRLAVALLLALHSLSISAETQPNKHAERNEAIGAVCFEVPSNYEIVIDGKKLIGSAQARRRNVVLQHGTFPLWGDLTRITQVLAFPDERRRKEATSRLVNHATTAEQVLGKRLEWDSVINAFIYGFQSALNIELIQEKIPATILDRTDILVKEKYGHPSWLKRI